MIATSLEEHKEPLLADLQQRLDLFKAQQAFVSKLCKQQEKQQRDAAASAGQQQQPGAQAAANNNQQQQQEAGPAGRYKSVQACMRRCSMASMHSMLSTSAKLLTLGQRLIVSGVRMPLCICCYYHTQVTTRCSA